MVFYRTSKIRKKNPDLNNKMDQWMCFIDDSNKGAVKMAENNNEVLKKARKELDYLTGDEAVRRLAELRDKWEMDDFFIKKRAKEEGEKAGEKRGKKEIAQKLIEKGMEIKEIIEITGLTENEIKKLTKPQK